MSAMELEQIEQNKAYLEQRNLRRQQLQNDHASPSYNNGYFANPAHEWEWRKAEAVKNRIRAEHDLGRGKNSDRDEFMSRMEEMDSKMEREEALMREKMAEKKRQEEARAVFFQNRQIAAAAKVRPRSRPFRSSAVDVQGSG